jgi:hypothetical protein
MLVGLACWEEVEHIYIGEFCANPVNTSNPLHYPRGVPRKIIVYYDI